MTFSPEKLRAIMTARGLTEAGLAAQCGWVRKTGRRAGKGGTSTIHCWLKGTSKPAHASLMLVANVLGVPVEALCED